MILEDNIYENYSKLRFFKSSLLFKYFNRGIEAYGNLKLSNKLDAEISKLLTNK
jgi:hypothetical protein